MYPYSIYLVLKVPIEGRLSGLSFYYNAIWSLWERKAGRVSSKRAQKDQERTRDDALITRSSNPWPIDAECHKPIPHP